MKCRPGKILNMPEGLSIFPPHCQPRTVVFTLRQRNEIYKNILDEQKGLFVGKNLYNFIFWTTFN